MSAVEIHRQAAYRLAKGRWQMLCEEAEQAGISSILPWHELPQRRRDLEVAAMERFLGLLARANREE